MAQEQTALNAEGKPITPAGKWLEIIDKHETAFQPWRDRCRKIEKIYTEQRRTNSKSKRRYAILWANISTLQPTVYARLPKPIVTRRFKDKDKVARKAGEMIERGLVYDLDKEDFNAVMRKGRDDLLLYSRGTSWNRYDAEFEPMMDDAGAPQMDEEGKPLERITSEKVKTEFVHWYDFGHAFGRVWEEVPQVWRKVYMDRKELIARFGEKIGKAIPLDHGPKSNDTTEHKDAKTKATVYELWDKISKKVYWIARGYAELCDEKPPLVDLEGFFPCPKPMYGTLSTDSLIPIPDYVYYQDQAEEIDDLTNKIDKLLDSLKLVGFYPAGTEGTAAIIKAMKPDSTDLLVPVAGWNAFAERGGSGQIQWVPIDIVITVLEGCYTARERIIQDIYQIMGLSDIQRGQTDPNETAEAQSLKSQYGSMRTQERQAIVQEFARDNIRIIGEIMAEKFQPETLLMMTGMKIPTAEEVQSFLMKQQLEQQKMAQAAQAQAVQAQQMPGGSPPPSPNGMPQGSPPNMNGQMPPQPGLSVMGGNGGPGGPMPGEEDVEEEPITEASVTVEQVFELLHNDKLRGYRIDIETDSTIIGDEQADKASWNEMLTAVSGFMQQALPMGNAVPEFVPVLGLMLQATIRKYRAGRELEDAIESATNALIKKTKAMANQPPPPSPEEQKAQVEIAALEKKSAIEERANAQEMDFKERTMKMEEAAAAREDQRAQNEHALKMQQQQDSHAMDKTKTYGDIALKMKAQQADVALSASEQEGSTEAAGVMTAAAEEIANAMKEIGTALLESSQKNTEAIVAAVSKPKKNKLVFDPESGRPIGSESE